MINLGQIAMIAMGWVECLAIFLLLASLWFSIKSGLKRSKGNQVWRIRLLLCFNVLAFIGLLGIILQPQFRSTDEEKVRLITSAAKNPGITNVNGLENSNVENSDHVAKRISPSVKHPSYRLNRKRSNTAQSKDRKTSIIYNAQQILFKHPQVQEIEVIGDGLFGTEWGDFGNVLIDYTRPDLISGLIDVGWNRQINLGEYVQFRGRYQSASDGIFTVRLIDPAGDRITETKVFSNEYFKLSARPKIDGLHAYTVEVLDDSQHHVSREIFRLNVRNTVRAKILVLQSAPSFEIKQFQNWAAEYGAQLMVKTRISRDKYLTRNTNFSRNDTARFKGVKLTPELFNDFDLLMVDGRGLLDLSVAELDWLQSAIENGLGLLVLVDQSLISRQEKQLPELLSGTLFQRQQESFEIVPYWQDNNGVLVAPTEQLLPSVAAIIQVKTKNIVNPERLVESGKGNLLVHQNNLGVGKVAVSLLRETHRWVTSGNKIAHSQFWQHLLSRIGRKREVATVYISANDFLNNGVLNFSDRLTRLCVSANESAKKVFLKHSSDLKFKQTVLLQPTIKNKDRACGYFWPRKTGWYHATIESERMNEEMNIIEPWLYFESQDDWVAIQQLNKIRATLNKQQAFNPDTASGIEFYYRPVNLWIFWWIFFVSASFIWLEKKFD